MAWTQAMLDMIDEVTVAKIKSGDFVIITKAEWNEYRALLKSANEAGQEKEAK